MPLSLSNKFGYAKDLDKYTMPKPQKGYKRICQHYTQGGSVSGAISWWQFLAAKPGGDKIGTPYIVDRDGTIYQLWDEATRWAWHLGIGSRDIDSTTLGIEAINYGPLDNRNCPVIAPTLGPVPDPIVYPTPWRGYSRFQRFPDAQMRSIVQLTKHLCEKYDIPYVFPQPAEIYEVNVPKWGQYEGILSHQNFRKDKVDCGPAYSWGAFLVDWDL